MKKILPCMAIITSVIIIFLTIFIYVLDSIITPTVMAAADAEMRAKALQIVNNSIMKECSERFNYEDIIRIEKDTDGNIVLLSADTLKMNSIACSVALNSQEELKKLGAVGIKIPMGYIFRNNILAYMGPDVTVKMQPIGRIEAKYFSKFESAGLNQTRHTIYLILTTDLRVIIPFRNNDIQVKNEVPVAETIVIGKVPDTSINLELEKAGFRLRNTDSDVVNRK